MTTAEVQIITRDAYEEQNIQEPKIPRLNDRLTQELVIALVGPIGSGCTQTGQILDDILSGDYGYEVYRYQLSDFIKNASNLVETNFDDLRGADLISKSQTAGDLLREKFDDWYLAAKAVEQIALTRGQDGFKSAKSGSPVPIQLRRVHIIDSIKHPKELKLLRDTYGDIFWLVGVFAPLSIREQRLRFQRRLDSEAINTIVQRDYREDGDHGQNVRDVFHQADLFIRNDQDNTSTLTKSLERFLEVLFGSPVHTPTSDESSMYAAYSEAAKSACLSRQVGAAIVSNDGELIGLGRNDVPSFGGGLYKEDHGDDDHRCHAWRSRHCHNDAKKEHLYDQIFDHLSNKELLSKEAKREDVAKAIQATDVKALIEYSRAVHAEMDAITSVARLNKAGILGGTLYSTTFPCHSCARHIVAAGITKVFFIEPYPKSLAIELHSDATSEMEVDEGSKVLFLQYSGIAPKNILNLFKTSRKRKEKGGNLLSFDKKMASPVVAVSLDDYATHEKWVIAELDEHEKQATDDRQATLPGL